MSVTYTGWLTTCRACSRVFDHRLALSAHLGGSEQCRASYTPLGDYDMPWHLIEVVDRGFTDVCWFTSQGVKKLYHIIRPIIGARDHDLIQHTCEKPGEFNHCVNPTHLIVGSKSTNVAHAHALRPTARDTMCDACGRLFVGSRGLSLHLHRHSPTCATALHEVER